MCRTTLVLIAFLFSLITALGQSASSDCSGAILLCDKSPVFIERLPEAGTSFKENSESTSCFGVDFTESNSIWFKWTAETNGDLGFTILPLNEADDIDFALYRLPEGMDICVNKVLLRCNASGPILGEEAVNEELCTGATGMNFLSDIPQKSKGCLNDGTNFVSPVILETGASYALFIHNYHSSSGFIIDFFGETVFRQFPEMCSPLSAEPSLERGKTSFSPVYPNPVQNAFRVDVDAQKVSDALWQIIDLNGHILRTQPFAYPEGRSSISIPTEAIAPGAYFLKIKCNGGVHIARFVKL